MVALPEGGQASKVYKGKICQVSEAVPPAAGTVPLATGKTAKLKKSHFKLQEQIHSTKQCTKGEKENLFKFQEQFY